MTGLPVFLKTGAAARSNALATRSSCSAVAAAAFWARASCRRSRSLAFSASATCNRTSQPHSIFIATLAYAKAGISVDVVVRAPGAHLLLRQVIPDSHFNRLPVLLAGRPRLSGTPPTALQCWSASTVWSNWHPAQSHTCTSVAHVASDIHSKHNHAVSFIENIS
mgnify:CR=1 FL=1